MYDIHCPLMGGPTYRMNYLRESCINRQKVNGCRHSKCSRRVAIRRDAPEDRTNVIQQKSTQRGKTPVQSDGKTRKRARHTSRLLANKRRLALRKGYDLAELNLE